MCPAWREAVTGKDAGHACGRSGGKDAPGEVLKKALQVRVILQGLVEQKAELLFGSGLAFVDGIEILQSLEVVIRRQQFFPFQACGLGNTQDLVGYPMIETS